VALSGLLLAPRPTETWSVYAVDLNSATPIADLDGDHVLPTASVGKVLLLIALAEAIEAGTIDPAMPLDRHTVDPVADSGLLRHLTLTHPSVTDLAVLVAAVSDNLATNLLLSTVGLGAVQDTATRWVSGGSALLDQVRDHRRPTDPPQLSVGCAADWARVFARLDATRATDPVARCVHAWLALGIDHSMVAAPLALDPLAPTTDPSALRWWGKTGSDPGVRADVGCIRRGDRAISYGVICHWSDHDETTTRQVVARMRGIGAWLLTTLAAGTGDGSP